MVVMDDVIRFVLKFQMFRLVHAIMNQSGHWEIILFKTCLVKSESTVLCAVLSRLN